MATTSSTSGRSSSREPPSTAAGRKGGGNYTSLNLQSYKGRSDGKGFGKGGHGMQSLGKVVATSRRMPSPASLPSLRSENAGNDPTVSLVPSGGGGWKKDRDGKEYQRESADAPPSPPPQTLQKRDPHAPHEGAAAKGRGGGSHRDAPPPPPLPAGHHPPSPGKRFKANFPSLEEQETMSKKDVDELHRRRDGKEGGPSPEPNTGNWRTAVKGGAWGHEPPHGVPPQEPMPGNMGPYGRYNYPPPPGAPPPPGQYPPPYMVHRHPPPGMPPFRGGPQMHNPPRPGGPGSAHFAPHHGNFGPPFPYSADPYKMPEGYHDDLSRPPTVKMDDIKNMTVEEEEEGGWAGHHEEVDYSKEVVFSDSSDEEGSTRTVKSSRTDEKLVYKPPQLQQGTGVKGDADGRSRQVGSDQEKWVEREEGQAWTSDMPHSPVEKADVDHREHYRQQKDTEKRRHDGDGSQRHDYHPYPPRSVPYPPPHAQYPPNYPPYPMYPPPAFGGRGGPHHYPPTQHVGGGNRYPPHAHASHRGPGAAHKRSYPEREEYGWVQDRDNRTGGGSKKKWDEKEVKMTILAKNEKKAGTLSLEDKLPVQSPKEESEAPPFQRTGSGSSDTPEGAGERRGVTFTGEQLVEEQVQSTRRGNQPKIMLKKFRDKEGEGSGGSRQEGKDRPGDLKNLRQLDGKGGGDADDVPGGDSSSKTKMAWNVTDRGPITSPKTLYEPEGKKSADKFKKYHAHIQEPRRGSKDEGATAEEETTTEKGKLPVERKEETQRTGKSESEHRHSARDEYKYEGVKPQGHESPDVPNKQGQEFSRQQSRDKPHHRKEDSRRPRGGERRQGQGGGYAEREPRYKADRRQDFPKTEGKGDDRDRRNKGEGKYDIANPRPENPERNMRDGTRRDSQDNNRTGGGKQQERRPSDHKTREEKSRKREVGPTYGRDGDHFDRGRGDRKPRGRGSGNASNTMPERVGVKKVSAESAVIAGSSETRSDDQKDARSRSGTGTRGPSKKPGQKREERPEREKRAAPPHRQDHPRNNKQGKTHDAREGASHMTHETREGASHVTHETREGVGHMTQKEKVHPGLGYSELIDIESGSEGETTMSAATADHGVGKVVERRDGTRPRHPVEDSKPRNRNTAPFVEDSRAVGNRGHVGYGNKRMAVSKRDDRRRGKRRNEDEITEPLQRTGSGRGRGRERRDGSHPQTVAVGSGDDQKSSDKSLEKGVAGEGGAEEEAESSTALESSGSLQKFDVSKYDLNSHKVAVVDDMALGQTTEESLLSPTLQAGFVEVTSKKTQKEKVRKEKEEQRREERRIEEQRKKKKNSSTKVQAGMEKSSSSANRPFTAWSTSEGKVVDAYMPEMWNAAPGSQLKAGPGLMQAQWLAATLPPAAADSYALGKGGTAAGGGGEAKAAMPHTAELVSSSDVSMNTSRYSLFGSRMYSPFSSSVTPMLDAAVDSTIATVTSPRTGPPTHAPLLPDPPIPGPPALPLEPPLADVNPTLHKKLVSPPRQQAPPPPLLAEVKVGREDKGLPPRLKSGTGRGRGAGQKGGVVERRERRRGREQGPKPEKERIPQTPPFNKGSMSNAAMSHKGEEERFYVHPRARSGDNGPSSELTSKSRPTDKEELKNEDQRSKVANNKKGWSRASESSGRAGRNFQHPYKHTRPHPHDNRSHNRRSFSSKENKPRPSRENKPEQPEKEAVVEKNLAIATVNSLDLI